MTTTGSHFALLVEKTAFVPSRFAGIFRLCVFWWKSKNDVGLPLFKNEVWADCSKEVSDIFISKNGPHMLVFSIRAVHELACSAEAGNFGQPRNQLDIGVTDSNTKSIAVPVTALRSCRPNPSFTIDHSSKPISHFTAYVDWTRNVLWNCWDAVIVLVAVVPWAKTKNSFSNMAAVFDLAGSIVSAHAVENIP